jgi:hypothetical protein
MYRTCLIIMNEKYKNLKTLKRIQKMGDTLIFLKVKKGRKRFRPFENLK